MKINPMKLRLFVFSSIACGEHLALNEHSEGEKLETGKEPCYRKPNVPVAPFSL